MLKTIARQIPQIDRLVQDRDDLRAYSEGLVLEVERLRTHSEGLVLEVERLRHQILTGNRPDVESHNRRDLLLRDLNLDGLGLEIGPSYGPLLPKSEGNRVETIDHADASHLREKYRKIGVDVSRVEEVDYVSDGRSILETIGKPGRYDYIVASHVIEHVPDLIGFLNDCASLLRPEGRLALAIPDKRFMFDAFQTLSTTGHVLDAHLVTARNPSPGAIFDHIANFVAHGKWHTWDSRDCTEAHLLNEIAEAGGAFERARVTNEYVDVHVWRFVPSSFRLILSDLNALGKTSLQEVCLAAPGTHEFFATLSRNAPSCQLDRLTLLKQIAAEQAALNFPNAPSCSYSAR